MKAQILIKQDQVNKANHHKFQKLEMKVKTLLSKSKDGDKLLAEPELAHQLGSSRSTLREVMRTFETQGLITRRQGIGTFVIKPQQVIDSGLEKLESIVSLAKRINLPVSIGHLLVQKIPVPNDLSKKMQITQDQLVLKIIRVILVEKKPVAFLVDMLPQSVLTEDELMKEFSGSVLDLLTAKQPQIKLEKSFCEIQAVPAPADIAHELQIQRGDVLLHFVSDLFTFSGKIIDHSYSYFLPGYFRFHVVRSVGG